MESHKTEGMDARFDKEFPKVKEDQFGFGILWNEKTEKMRLFLHSELSIQREEYEKKMEILEDVCDKYSKAISLASPIISPSSN